MRPVTQHLITVDQDEDGCVARRGVFSGLEDGRIGYMQLCLDDTTHSVPLIECRVVCRLVVAQVVTPLNASLCADLAKPKKRFQHVVLDILFIKECS